MTAITANANTPTLGTGDTDSYGAGPASSRPTFDDANLRYWLGNEDWYMSQYTRRWLDRTPAEQAANVLARIAQDAQPEPTSPLRRLVIVVALSGFANSVAGVAERKAGIRAALLLARLGDFRAVAPLTRVFDPYGSWQSKYQQEIEAELTRLFTSAAESGNLGSHVAEARLVIERAWGEGDAKSHRRDLSSSLTALLLAAVRYLRTVSRSSSTSISAMAVAGLRALTDGTTTGRVDPARQPNRAQVQKEAGRA